MNRLLLVLLLAPSTMAAQSTLNDLDGDGCVGATDILVILGQYGECQDTTTAFVCGDYVLFDNYWYETVMIGDQCWFAENLRTTTYADGTAIPEVMDNSTWTGLSSGARCDYGNDSSNVLTYGRLYNWFATMDSAGLCPPNWHVPTDIEWSFLEIELGMGDDVWSSGWRGTDEGSNLKSAIEWDGTNATGYSAIPCGSRVDNGNFNELGVYSHIWSSSPLSDWAGWRRTMRTSRADVLRAQLDRNWGLSVRCLKDPE